MDSKFQVLSAILIVVFLRMVSSQKLSLCATVIFRAKDCMENSLAISSCDKNHTKSEALLCAEQAEEDLEKCDEDLAAKFVHRVADIYRLSEEIICENNFLEELNNDDCWLAVKDTANDFAHFLFPFYSDNGCKIIRTFMGASFKNSCNAIESYITKMYEKSSCSHAILPNQEEISESKWCSAALNEAPKCVIIHGYQIPNCSVENREIIECFNQAKDITCPFYSTEAILQQTQWRFKKAVDIFCNDKKLQKELIQHDCWQLNARINVITKGLMEGHLSPEGCKNFKYLTRKENENLKIGCFDVIRKVDEIMRTQVPCFSCAYLNYQLSFLYVFISFAIICCL